MTWEHIFETLVVLHRKSIISFHLCCMLGGGIWVKSNLFQFIEGETHCSTSWHAKTSLTHTECSSFKPPHDFLQACRHWGLTKDGRSCMQNNQLLTKNHVDLEDDSIFSSLLHFITWIMCPFGALIAHSTCDPWKRASFPPGVRYPMLLSKESLLCHGKGWRMRLDFMISNKTRTKKSHWVRGYLYYTLQIRTWAL